MEKVTPQGKCCLNKENIKFHKTRFINKGKESFNKGKESSNKGKESFNKGKNGSTTKRLLHKENIG